MKEVTTAEFVLTKDELDLLASAYQESSSHDKPKNHLYEMKIRTNRGKSDWSKPTRLWLWYFPEGNRFQLVGIEHLD
jgi:hypothetical protein